MSDYLLGHQPLIQSFKSFQTQTQQNCYLKNTSSSIGPWLSWKLQLAGSSTKRRLSVTAFLK
jgi:hypothetical protein